MKSVKIVLVVVLLLVGFNCVLIGAGENGSVVVNDSLDEDLNDSVVIVDLINGSVIGVNGSVMGVNDSININESLLNVSDEFEYINIDDISEDFNGSVDDEFTPQKHEESSTPSSSCGGLEDEDSPEKVLKSLVKDGRVEIEFESYEDEVVEIEKKEKLTGEFSKVVLISSEEHFDDELRVYSDLPVAALEENVVITWENGNEIVEDVEYYDEDGDGLVERVSWVVPHLSTQYYNIEILVEGINSSSEEIILSVTMPANNSTVSNPIEFNISINYTNLSDVSCMLKIDDVEKTYTFDEENWTSFPDINLSSGLKNWMIECWDGNFYTSTIKSSTSGFFNVFDFSIDGVDDFYFGSENVSGKINYQGVSEVTGLKLNGNNVVYDLDGNFVIKSSDTSTLGTYELVATTNYYEQELNVSKSFSVGEITLGFESGVEEDEDVDFVIAGDNLPTSTTYDLHIGTTVDTGNYGSKTITHSFSSGTYEVWLKNIKINGESYDNINFGELNVENSVDSDGPEVNLNYPEWGYIVKDSVIEFSYDVEDNVDVANCSFELHNAHESSSGGYEADDLIFPISSADKKLAFNDSLGGSDSVEIKLIDFDDGNYSWEVRCYDSAGNLGYDFNYFSVEFFGSNESSNSVAEHYDREDEVADLIDSINGFLESEDELGVEERRVLDILGFGENMIDYRRLLMQKDQDLKFGFNIKENRIAEIYEEIDEIKDGLILGIEVEDSYEFSKNSIDVSIEDVISSYMEAEDVEIGRNAFRGLIDFNEVLQNRLRVGVESWKLKVEYVDGFKDLVLVRKDLILNGHDSSEPDVEDFNGVILEVVGKESVVFVTEGRDVGSGVWEFGSDVSEIVYYFSPEDDFDLGKIEKTETLLFSDEGSENIGMITGFFVGVSDGLDFVSFFGLVGFLFVGYVGFFIFGKVRLESWKKDSNVVQILDLISQAKILVRRNDVEGARDSYGKMKDVYKILPRKCKGFFYKEIGLIHLAINKKDVLNLVREYEAAKNDFRKDDAVRIHGRINEIYKKLPRKFQDKVYRRIVKGEV